MTEQDPAPDEGETTLVFNRQMRLFWNDDPQAPLARATDPFRNEQFEIDDDQVLALCEHALLPRSEAELRTWLSENEVEADEIESTLRTLQETNILVPSSASSWTKWDEYTWGEAAYFHFSSRNQRFLDEQNAPEANEAREQALRAALEKSPAPRFFTKRAVDYRALPEPASSEMDLFDVLMERRTTRKYSGASTSLQTLASVLHDGCRFARKQRIDAESGYQDDPTLLLKSWGSALEVYVVAHRVDDLAQGVYHYDMREHGLGLIREGDFEDRVYHGIWGQPMANDACFSIFLAADLERYMWRYRYDRGLRNLLINVGEMAQTLILAGIAHELGNCMTPAMRDSDVDDLLGLDSAVEQAVYFLGFGQP